MLNIYTIQLQDPMANEHRHKVNENISWQLNGLFVGAHALHMLSLHKPNAAFSYNSECIYVAYAKHIQTPSLAYIMNIGTVYGLCIC